ncbi:MAG: hypothetical protein DI597_14460 [Pseudoxanthomonas spadix]|nr:MAG: hypothetical protein DI597_14460 [Pseudoxanthomonas spadix]
MNTNLHHPAPEAIGQHPEDVSEKSERPTRLSPLACDCCGKSASYLQLRRTTVVFPFAELPFWLCFECEAEPEDAEAGRLDRYQWILSRAGRFGPEWQDAVADQLMEAQA